MRMHIHTYTHKYTLRKAPQHTSFHTHGYGNTRENGNISSVFMGGDGRGGQGENDGANTWEPAPLFVGGFWSIWKGRSCTGAAPRGHRQVRGGLHHGDVGGPGWEAAKQGHTRFLPFFLSLQSSCFFWVLLLS